MGLLGVYSYCKVYKSTRPAGEYLHINRKIHSLHKKKEKATTVEKYTLSDVGAQLLFKKSSIMLRKYKDVKLLIWETKQLNLTIVLKIWKFNNFQSSIT